MRNFGLPMRPMRPGRRADIVTLCCWFVTVLGLVLLLFAVT